MKNVYILTEEGNGFTDQCCEVVTERIRKHYKDNSELTFGSGTIFNDPEHLIQCVNEHPDCYITISTENNVVTICEVAVNELCEKLKDANGKTSWEVAAEMVEEWRTYFERR